MSSFDERWRRLAAASRRAPQPPLAALPERIVALRAPARGASPGPYPGRSLLERFALRAAFALGAAAYAVAAWLLPLSLDGDGRGIAPLPRPSLSSMMALPRPPGLPPPRGLFMAIGDAVASLSGGWSITRGTSVDGAAPDPQDPHQPAAAPSPDHPTRNASGTSL